MIGWAFECAWQLFFLLESPAGMWVCLVMILGAFAAFAQTLLRLYRFANQLGFCMRSELRAQD